MSLPAASKPVAFVLTRDRAKSIPFYRDVLGCRLVSEDAHATVFDIHGVQMRLTPIPDHVGAPHTVLGWNVADMTSAVEALAAKGVQFTIYEGFGQDALGVWTSPDGQAKVAWFKDPDSNVLSLTQVG
jgi:catechol 2,3-dioxygenase-like lactoylglutathione lyase family enzyme